ncbi:DUF2933 domain-containing protein [Burkholderia oklahomensis]|nr:DUF2933 domain-containing protein [Burkholderia oklahomensis]
MPVRTTRRPASSGARLRHINSHLATGTTVERSSAVERCSGPRIESVLSIRNCNGRRPARNAIRDCSPCAGIVGCGRAVRAIAAFVPLPRHRYPLLGFPPYLLLLAGPPAHLVMRRGHRHRRASGNDARRDSEDDHERHR